MKFTTVGTRWKNAFGHDLKKSIFAPLLEKILPTPMCMKTCTMISL